MALQRSQLPYRKGANRSAGERTEPKRSESRARQREHPMTERFEHPPDLPVPAFVNRQIHDTVVAADGDDANLCCRRAEIVDAHAPLKRPYLFGGKPPGDRGPVGLFHAEARVKQPVSEFAVVREQQDAGGIVVEPPHGHRMDAVGKQIRYRAPALRIPHRGDHAYRFVHDQVGRPARRPDDSPFDFNMVY